MDGAAFKVGVVHQDSGWHISNKREELAVKQPWMTGGEACSHSHSNRDSRHCDYEGGDNHASPQCVDWAVDQSPLAPS